MIGDPDVDDDNNRPEMGKIEIEPKCPDCCPFCFLEACMNPRICPETKRPKETLERTKCPACCAGHCELKECSMPEICPQSLQSLPNPISNQAKKEPNSPLPNSSNCPIACPNCCDDEACGADEQKYCYECCPSPAKERNGRLKKEGEVCGQSCGEDCGECEAGLTCIQSISPSCRCGTCKPTFS